MEKRLTAQEARDLAGLSNEEKANEAVNIAITIIHNAAKNKSRKVNLTDDFWTHGGYKPSESWKLAKKILEDLGYKVEFFYTERQFVSMYTIISW
jgi:ABC-type proline/glycine betaine transport system substrate-binding protein